MGIEELRSFFMWCTIINSALALWVFLIFVFAGKAIYKYHARWFPMSEESFYRVNYSFLGIYKVLIFVFNIVPFVALAIIG